MKKLYVIAAIIAGVLMVCSCKNGSNESKGEGNKTEQEGQNADGKKCDGNKCNGNCADCDKKCCEAECAECDGECPECKEGCEKDACCEMLEGVEGCEGKAEALAAAQIPEKEEYDAETDSFAFDDEPEFNGGDEDDFIEYVEKNIKYPISAQEAGKEGIVKVAFTVNKEGKICNVKVINSVSKDLDDEAVRVISNAPAWKPGTINGKPVNVKYSIPVAFEID